MWLPSRRPLLTCARAERTGGSRPKPDAGACQFEVWDRRLLMFLANSEAEPQSSPLRPGRSPSEARNSAASAISRGCPTLRIATSRFGLSPGGRPVGIGSDAHW